MRWREIKQGKNQKQKEDANEDENYATYPQRIKALIVDLFMIYMPILYVMTYFVLEGKDDFQNSTFAPLIAWSIYGLIYAILLARSGQTPGKKAYDIKVVKANGQHLSFLRSVARYILFLFSATILIGVLLPLVRKDKKALHDLILNTKEIDVS
jgi:uncharacterized RDD family membrane protein YckC